MIRTHRSVSRYAALKRRQFNTRRNLGHNAGMRAVVQRVLEASVTVDGEVTGRCGAGLMLLVGVKRDDAPANAVKLAQKVVNLRIFNDAEGKMNLSLLDLQASGQSVGILAVSNFTVYGDAEKSRRPSFFLAAPFDEGRQVFDEFLSALNGHGVPTETGVYGAHMEVRLVNDGPVTLMLEA